jgi:hypothetical protein
MKFLNCNKSIFMVYNQIPLWHKGHFKKMGLNFSFIVE